MTFAGEYVTEAFVQPNSKKNVPKSTSELNKRFIGELNKPFIDPVRTLMSRYRRWTHRFSQTMVEEVSGDKNARVTAMSDTGNRFIPPRDRMPCQEHYA